MKTFQYLSGKHENETLKFSNSKNEIFEKATSKQQWYRMDFMRSRPPPPQQYGGDKLS
jgi:hypothetical protein